MTVEIEPGVSTAPLSADGGADWRVLMAPGLADRARDVGFELLAVLRDAAAVTQAIARAEAVAPGWWHAGSVASGDAGLAAACGQLDRVRPGEGWDKVGHRYLARGVAAIPRAAGLLGGVCGVAFATRMLSRDRDRYVRLLAQLDARSAARATRLAGEVTPAGTLASAQYDLVSGLAGVGRYLLLAATEDACAAEALARVLARLIELIGEDPGIGLATPPGRLREDERAAAPHGHVNCGLAHGVPGPVALLALAARSGIDAPGLTAALGTGADWLVTHRTDDEYGPNWPDAIPIGPTERPRAARTAWCYGAPGVARAVWLAGEALDRDDLRALGVESLKGALRRPEPIQQIGSATFCHGDAGLLQIALRMARDSGDPQLIDGASLVLERLLGRREPDSLLGFRDRRPGGVVVDEIGLLDGVTGVGLALLAAAEPIEPIWDQLFLLT